MVRHGIQRLVFGHDLGTLAGVAVATLAWASLAWFAYWMGPMAANAAGAGVRTCETAGR
jgi:hypothetical protein